MHSVKEVSRYKNMEFHCLSLTLHIAYSLEKRMLQTQMSLVKKGPKQCILTLLMLQERVEFNERRRTNANFAFFYLSILPARFSFSFKDSRQ